MICLVENIIYKVKFKTLNSRFLWRNKEGYNGRWADNIWTYLLRHGVIILGG